MSTPIIKSDAWAKWYDAPLTDFSPERLRAARAEQESGYFIETDALFSAMYHEWDALQKDVNTMAGAVSSLQWHAIPATDDGDKPSDQAKAVAELVNKALWRGMRQPSGDWRHNFSELIGCVYHALCRGVNVHEIDWRMAEGMWYPHSFLPVSPQFFRWETQGGKPDRLLLFRDGVLGGGEGEAFPADRFVVALNNMGPDHPMRNALFVSLVGWFGASHWGLRWLMGYCQIFGIPFRAFNIHADDDKTRLQSMIDGGQVIQDIILDGDDKVEIMSTSHGTSIPQAELISMAEKACHKLILGQTLTSDTSDGGSRAQAEVHSEVQSAEVLAIGNFIAGVLNAQLIPAIVRMNYGNMTVPMPELRCSLPGSKASKEKIELYDGMINKLRMPLLKSAVYDDLGQTIPGEGDEVLTPAAAPMPGMDAISSAAAVLAEYSKKTSPRTL